MVEYLSKLIYLASQQRRLKQSRYNLTIFGAYSARSNKAINQLLIAFCRMLGLESRG
jgi:hypothetical protein